MTTSASDNDECSTDDSSEIQIHTDTSIEFFSDSSDDEHLVSSMANVTIRTPTRQATSAVNSRLRGRQATDARPVTTGPLPRRQFPRFAPNFTSDTSISASMPVRRRAAIQLGGKSPPHCSQYILTSSPGTGHPTQAVAAGGPSDAIDPPRMCFLFPFATTDDLFQPRTRRMTRSYLPARTYRRESVLWRLVVPISTCAACGA